MIVFGSQLWQRPDDYGPPAITHDDPLVMDLAKTLMNASHEGYDWDDQMKGAMQESEYYAHTYRQNIQNYIEMAIAVRKYFP